VPVPSRRTIALVGLLAVVLVAGGVGAIATAPRMLVVTRTGVAPWDHPGSLARIDADAASVRRVYDALQALPRASPGSYNCPSDSGIVYNLTFLRHGSVALAASAPATGCRLIQVGAGDVRTSDDAFWATLAGAMGVSPHDLIAP
jgi:hypothetical protein